MINLQNLNVIYCGEWVKEMERTKKFLHLQEQICPILPRSNFDLTGQKRSPTFYILALKIGIIYFLLGGGGD